MKILKYLFLLLLLSVVALSIFIATQKGDYEVERSKIVKAPLSSVFNVINDFKHWDSFASWIIEDSEINLTFSQNTAGKNANFSWYGKQETGDVTTIAVSENDSIVQKTNFNDNESMTYWKFKDTVGGTKVTWKTKGKMNFSFKIYTALNGGIDRVLGSMQEKSLANLGKALTTEINTFSVKVSGVVTRPTTFYIGQTFTSEFAKINKNFKIIIPKLEAFCKESNSHVVGKPFIIYHNYNEQSRIARITVALPIQNEIFISSGSDLNAGKLEAFEAVKATLYGDNSHSKDAYNKALQFLTDNNLNRDPKISHIEIYTVNKKEIKNPSKWITELYLVLAPKVIPVKRYIPLPSINPDSTGSTGSDQNLTDADKNAIPRPAVKLNEPKKPIIIKSEEESEF
jgi:ribosome-associated toxin RatA of RatAB toxin-antitoxin module